MRRLSPLMPLATLLLSTPLVAQDEPESVFVRGEYWTCPQKNIDALAQATDSIWAPILDGMVAEEVFVAWGRALPLKALPIKRGQPGEPSEVEPEWDWVLSFTATNEEAFHSAWEEFFARLKAKFPDMPKPWLFCEEVVLVDYQMPVPR